MVRPKFIPLLIVAVGLAVYSNSLNAPFIFDDAPSITENPYVRHLWPIGEAMSWPRDTTVAGRPVVALSLAVNYALGGFDVWGYHVFNLTVHILNALLLFGIVRRTLARLQGTGDRRQTTNDGSRAAWLAAVIALAWLAHPLQTESVTYVIQRTELLMGLFLLLTLYCVIRGHGSAHAKRWHTAAVAACALGMGSKETMVVAPIVVAAYDRIFLAASWREMLRHRKWLYTGLAATWLILIVALITNPHGESAGFGFADLTPWAYARSQCGVILHYLRLSFWPQPLVLDYHDWPISKSLADVAPQAAVVLALLAATVWALRFRPAWGFLGAWFFLILGPTSSVLPLHGELAAERRMYLPLAAVVAAAVMSWNATASFLRQKTSGRQTARWAEPLLLAVIVGLLICATFDRNRDFRSRVSIWADTAAKRPNNVRAHTNLGMVLQEVGRIDEAIEQYHEALRIKPDFASAHNNLGLAYLAKKNYDKAVEHLERAIHDSPEGAAPYLNLAITLDAMGRHQDAERHCREALRLQPDFAEAHSQLGIVLTRQGRFKEAMAAHSRAIQLNPAAPRPYCYMGVALAAQGRFADAITHYSEALRLQSDYPEAHYNYGIALAALGKTDAAIRQYREALRVKPDYADARINLGVALQRVGKIQEAIEQFRAALRLAPDDADTHYNLGVTLSAQRQTADALAHFIAAEKIYAAKKDFASAADCAGKARDLALATAQKDLVAEIESRLKTYRDAATRP
jgi:tetratricopeptide (TPR) repeat protein